MQADAYGMWEFDALLLIINALAAVLFIIA